MITPGTLFDDWSSMLIMTVYVWLCVCVSLFDAFPPIGVARIFN